MFLILITAESLEDHVNEDNCTTSQALSNHPLKQSHHFSPFNFKRMLEAMSYQWGTLFLLCGNTSHEIDGILHDKLATMWAASMSQCNERQLYQLHHSIVIQSQQMLQAFGDFDKVWAKGCNEFFAETRMLQFGGLLEENIPLVVCFLISESSNNSYSLATCQPIDLCNALEKI